MDSNILTIINDTDPPYNSLRIAVYQKDIQQPDQDIVAWVTASPAANGGRCNIACPDIYEVYFEYPDPDYEGNNVTYQSNVVTINSYTALLQVVANEDDASGQITLSLQPLTGKKPIDGHIQVQMPAVGGTLLHYVNVYVAKEGQPVVPSVSAPPGTTADFEITPTYYAGFVDNVTAPGALLKAADLASSEVPVQPGQTATVTGNNNVGFTITVLDS